MLGALYCIYHFQTSGTKWHFIDNADLFVHEVGHFVFAPFGEFMAVAGGSLFQLLVPVAFFGYFTWSDQKFSAAAMLLWLSVNFFYVAVYAADALKMELPLVGGEGVIHDWNYLLLNTGLIRHAQTVSNTIYFLGLVSIFTALYLTWVNMNKQESSAENWNRI